MRQFKIFYYNDIPIRFELGDDSVMMCATELGKQFGQSKKPVSWLRTKKAKNIIKSVSKETGLKPENLVIVQNGGLVSGTWMHSNVAIEYARWLSMDFGTWCTSNIKDMILDMDKRVMDDKRVDVVDFKIPNKCYMEDSQKHFSNWALNGKKNEYLSYYLGAIWKFCLKINQLIHIGR